MKKYIRVIKKYIEVVVDFYKWLKLYLYALWMDLKKKTISLYEIVDEINFNFYFYALRICIKIFIFYWVTKYVGFPWPKIDTDSWLELFVFVWAMTWADFLIKKVVNFIFGDD